MSTFDIVLGLVSILTIFFVSAYFYNHSGKKYSEGKSKKIVSTKSFGFAYRWIQISTIGAAVVSIVFSLPLFLEVHNSPALLYIGLGIAFVGVLIFIQAKIQLGAHYSPCFDSFLPTDIMREGLYKYIRHPIYSANLVLLSGLGIATGSWLIAINTLVLAVYYVKAAKLEEVALSESFPAYRTYKTETGMLIPRIIHRSERAAEQKIAINQ